jgi:hypothetical protein
MNENDRDNIRSMMQMRDRSPVENAAYALGALSNDDKVSAVKMFNQIWGDANRRQYATLNIQFTGFTK